MQNVLVSKRVSPKLKAGLARAGAQYGLGIADPGYLWWSHDGGLTWTKEAAAGVRI